MILVTIGHWSHRKFIVPRSRSFCIIFIGGGGAPTYLTEISRLQEHKISAKSEWIQLLMSSDSSPIRSPRFESSQAWGWGWARARTVFSTLNPFFDPAAFIAHALDWAGSDRISGMRGFRRASAILPLSQFAHSVKDQRSRSSPPC